MTPDETIVISEKFKAVLIALNKLYINWGSGRTQNVDEALEELMEKYDEMLD